MVQKLEAGVGNYVKVCNSGVVALDKNRLGILVALLHTCDLRQLMYGIMIGDKDSW